jgi:hypothetical protein
MDAMSSSSLGAGVYDMHINRYDLSSCDFGPIIIAFSLWRQTAVVGKREKAQKKSILNHRIFS